MANIKFSAFTQKVVQTSVDFLVGYTGADNVRITPAALGDGIYLPLGGGNMTGDLVCNDGVAAAFGTGLDAFFKHSGSDFEFFNDKGNVTFNQRADDKDIKFYCDDGAGGVTEYFRLDGSVELNRFYKNVKLDDNVVLQIGSSADLQIKHDATDSFIENITGDLYITNKVDDKDIIFQSDNGSGAVSQYFRLDGSWADGTNVFTAWPDNSIIALGDGADLKIYHDASHSRIDEVGTGGLIIRTGDFYLRNPSDEEMIYATSGGAVDIYFNNSKKFETTATGIQVTDEVSIGTSLVHTGDTDTKVTFGTNNITLIAGGATHFIAESDQTTILYSGNAQTIFCDTIQRVGIGTTGPAKKLDVTVDTNDDGILLQVSGRKAMELIVNSGVNGQGMLNFYTGNTLHYGRINADSEGLNLDTIANRSMIFKKAGTEAMRIDTSGNLGIGTGIPTAALQVVGLVEYADNATAITAGLTAGAFYRTGDLLKVVH